MSRTQLCAKERGVLRHLLSSGTHSTITCGIGSKSICVPVAGQMQAGDGQRLQLVDHEAGPAKTIEALCRPILQAPKLRQMVSLPSWREGAFNQLIQILGARSVNRAAYQHVMSLPSRLNRTYSVTCRTFPP